MIYAVSDLHGYPLDGFRKLLEKADFSESDFCFVLGDVIDRETEGIKILQWLMGQPNFELILGNHEAMMLACDFLFDEITEDSIASLTETKMSLYSTWISNGGLQTLNELARVGKGNIKYILEYLREAPLYDTVTAGGKDFLLTHSGLGLFDKSKKISDYSESDLLWNRPDLNARYFDDVITVFGHTPTLYYGSEFKGRAIVTETWIDIDAGAACGEKPMLLRLDDLREFYL